MESFTDSDLVPFIKVTGDNASPVKSAAVIKATRIGGGGGGGEVTGVKGDSESSYRKGNVNITKANIGLGNVDDKSSATLKGEIMTGANVKTALGCQQGGTKYLKEDGSWDTPAGGGGVEQIQSDWNQTNTSAKDYIWNKPTSMPANGGNAATVNSHSVEKDVPSDAVFTDHTYSVMGASGSTHASGLVPDTPTTAGTSKFLREDGQWAEPQGGGGGGNTADVNYDTTNKKITKTIDGVTSDVVTVATLKTDMNLGNVGNFKAVSTVASQGLSDTEKSNARTNIGAGTYSKPSGGIPETDFTQNVQDRMMVSNLSCEPIVGLSTYELLEGKNYGLMQSVVATSNYVLGFIHQQHAKSSDTYTETLFCVMFDYNGRYLGKSNLGVNTHGNDSTIIGDYTYICGGGTSGVGLSGVWKVKTSDLITNCQSGASTTLSSVSSINFISLDYDSTSDDICGFVGENLNVYNKSFTLQRTAVTDAVSQIQTKFGSYMDSYTVQGLVYKNDKAYMIGVADMSKLITCTIVSVFDLASGNIINVYKIPAFSSYLEIQGCFKSPLRDDEILASYNVWGGTSIDNPSDPNSPVKVSRDGGTTILGVLRVSLSGMVSSPVHSIRVEAPTFDERNRNRVVFVDNSASNTGPSAGTVDAPFKRIEDVYALISDTNNIDIRLANTDTEYHVHDLIYGRNSTISISTWYKNDSSTKAKLAAIFKIRHCQLNLSNLSITMEGTYPFIEGTGHDCILDVTCSDVTLDSCSISMSVANKMQIFYAQNSKIIVYSSCSLSNPNNIFKLDGNNIVTILKDGSSKLSISCNSFVQATTGDSVHLDIRDVNNFSSVSRSLVDANRCTEPVLFISNANLDNQAQILKAACISNSSRGSIAVVQDSSWSDTFQRGIYTNDPSYGTVEGYVFYERTTGVPLVYRKKGTTDQRPTLSGYTGKDVLPYNNITTGKIEFWNGSAWV